MVPKFKHILLWHYNDAFIDWKAPWDIAEDIQHALNEGEFNAILDPSARCWPYVQAAQLSHLALRCCAASCSHRPDLASEVLTVLESSCGASSSLDSSVEDDRYHERSTYCSRWVYLRSRDIEEWMQRGNTSSPLTNVRLAHNNLIPNYSLRSAIQEWLQRH